VHGVDAADLIEDLASGCASVKAVRALAHEQSLKRLLMLKILLDRGGEQHPAQFARADFVSGLETLARLQVDHPQMIGRLLHYPGTGAWLGHSLRRLTARAESRVPLWVDLGYMGWLAAAARAQVREFGSSPIVIREGCVVLPGMGLARVGSGMASGVGQFEVTAEGLAIQYVGSSLPLMVHTDTASTSWTPLRHLMVPGFAQEGIVLDAADPFLSAMGTLPSPAARTVSADTGRTPWEALLLAADRLLDTACPAHRAPVAAWLRVMQPKGRGPEYAASDTSPESFGSVAMSTPRDAPELARTLVHEFQHALLGALQDCVSLTQPSSGRQFYAPWVGAMRPAEMLLQGAYAHLGVAVFCRGYGRCAVRRSARKHADEECDSLASQVSWALDQLRTPGTLTSQGAQFVGRLRQAAARLRSPRARPPVHVAINPPPPLTATILTAYSDLRSERGPLHAQVTADLGSRLLQGSPFPPYQVVTPAGLRASIAADWPGLRTLSDPRQMQPRQRSAPWSFLCDELDGWDRLDLAEQLRAARVLARLGFWALLASLPVRHDPINCPLDGLRLMALHCTALRTVRGATAELGAESFRIQRSIAANPDLPVSARLSAAVNATVMHGRSGSHPAAVWECVGVAQQLVSQAARGELSDLLLSAYWRGISFAPLAEGNHRLVAEMLDESERIARQAVASTTPEQRLLTAENLHLVLETRGQAAGLSNDARSADYFAEFARRDQLDARAFTRLGDYFLSHNEYTRADHAYRRAALLGAPFTAYARGLIALLEDPDLLQRRRIGTLPAPGPAWYPRHSSRHDSSQCTG
jgi:HEXXH motif-containing protein